jgi:hypothetical protein
VAKAESLCSCGILPGIGGIAGKSRQEAGAIKKMVKKTVFAAAAIAACLGISPALVNPAAAQALSSTTLGLYPPDAGEVAFADLRALRQSPHYAQIRAELLPERLRQLESFAQALGIDLETQAQQMSWVFVIPAQGGPEELLSVVEGAFSPVTVLERAKASKLVVAQASGVAEISAGKNDRGQEFLIALADAATLVFGPRPAVEALLARRAEGRGGIAGDSVLSPWIEEKNGHSPVWVVLDQKFTALALRQMAPTLAAQPEAQTLLAAVNSSTLELTLTRDFSGHASLHCRGAQEAQLLAAIVQGGIALAASRSSESSPELAAALRAATVELQGNNVDARLNVPEAQVATLLQKNSLQLKF